MRDKIEYIATVDNLKFFNTKFLIEYEDKVDWEALSYLRKFSATEMKLFGNSIKWNIYIINHQMSEEEIIVSLKYLTTDKIERLVIYQDLSESFMRKYRDVLTWRLVLSRQYFTEEFLFEMFDYWKSYDIEFVQSLLLSNSSIDLNSGNYNKLLLYLKLKD
jgi:hypothetical protein